MGEIWACVNSSKHGKNLCWLFENFLLLSQVYRFITFRDVNGKIKLMKVLGYGLFPPAFGLHLVNYSIQKNTYPEALERAQRLFN
jgi:hypothetical protein